MHFLYWSTGFARSSTSLGVYKKLGGPRNPKPGRATLQRAEQMLTTGFTVGIEYLIQEKWGGSTQVVTLGQSLFIVGTAVGPAFMGPLS
jgi:hypothetical protein